MSERAAQAAKAAADQPTRLRDRLTSAGLWAAGLSWMVPMMGAMMISAKFRDPDKTEALSRLYCRGQVRATGARWRAVVDPAVREDTQYFFASNHVNLLDHVTMYNATPHFKQGMELASHFKIPVYGPFMKQRGTIGVVPRKEGGKPEHLVAACRKELDRGHSILVFPEGTRTRTGRVRTFRSGTFRMAKELEVGVVPVAVTGMFDILKPGSGLMRRGREVTVYCDAPVYAEDFESVHDFARHVQGVVSARVDAYWEAQAEERS